MNLLGDQLFPNIKRWKLSTAQKRKSVSWGDARTKGKVQECELTKNMFLHSDLFKLRQKKNITSLSSSLTQLCFTIIKIVFQGNEVKI